MAVKGAASRLTGIRTTHSKKTALPPRQPQAAPPIPPERESLKIPFEMPMRDKELSGFTENITPECLRFVSDAALRPGTAVTIQFTFGENVCYLNIAGRVVSCESCGEVATKKHINEIRFVAIREWEHKILVSAIEALKQSPPMQEKSLVKIQVSHDTLALEAAQLLAHTAESHSTESLKERKTRKSFTPHPAWVQDMNRHLEPYRNAILECKLVQGGSTGTLPLKKMRTWIIQLYPFIETFPKWIALNITKTHDARSRGYMIDNVRVEKRHAEQWIYMAQGFGIDPYVLYTVQPLPDVEALTHWLWSINTRGSFAEAVGATNYSIEGVTRDIAKLMIKGFPYYDGKESIRLDKKAYWWAEAHSRYDDLHPEQSLEVMEMYATTKELQEKTVFATQRSYEYLLMALEACYTYEDTTEVETQYAPSAIFL
jgi:pyrroloquinoline quinone (PQQ) biosynthesis protein C